MRRIITTIALVAAGTAVSAQNWPSFRGPNAAGVADGAPTAVKWDAPAGENVAWKTPVDGVAVSSPIVWGDRVFVSTAVSSAPGAGHPHRPLRRRRAGHGRLQAHVAPPGARQGDRQGRLGQGRLRRHAEDEAPPQVQPGLGDAGHRRHARDRVVRLRGPLRLRLRRQAAVEAGPRRAERRLVLRSRLRVGHRQLADHLQEHGDRAVRHPEGVVPGGVRHGLRERGVAHRARGDPVLVHADHLRGQRPGGAGDAGDQRSPAATIRTPARSCGGTPATPRSPSPRRSSAPVSSSSPTATAACSRSSRSSRERAATSR